MFKLRIETKNDAFTNDRIGEITRILKEAIIKLERGETEPTLHDLNGGIVGYYSLTKR